MYIIIILEVQKRGIDMYQCVTKNFANAVFAYLVSTLWSDLPDEVKESGSLEGFKHNYRFFTG